MNCRRRTRRRRRHPFLRRRAVSAILIGLGVAGAMVGAVPGGSATSAAGEATVPVTVPAAAQTTPSPAALAPFIDPNVAKLLDDKDPAGSARARENLSAGTMVNGQPGSPAFLLTYGQVLNNALVKALAPANKPTLRQRLNAAIVVSRVATVSQNASLEPITLQLLNDPAEPVVMWALKAAQPQVPPLLAAKLGNQAPRLLTAILPAVTKHPSGPIFDEAYSALAVDDPLVKDELVKLWGTRLLQYTDRGGCPDDPDVDGEPVFTLTTAGMWKTVLTTPQAQTDVMQRISDQLSLAAQWADQSQPGEKRDQLAKLIRQCAEGCSVVGKHQNVAALDAAATAPMALDPKRRPLPPKLLPVVTPLLTAIAAAYPNVKPAPTINPAGGGGGAGGGAAAAGGGGGGGAQ